MKSMLSGVDLHMAKRPLVHPAFNNLVDRHMAEKHIDNLTKALVAAMAVIDAWQTMAEVENITNGGIRHCLEKRAELETALEPFRVAPA